jgi:glutathione S-transferase
MAVKLHRCSGLWAKFAAHPCWRVQKALDEQGVEYELVQEGSAFKSSSRPRTIEKTGQKRFPWIEFEDGSVYREESADMAKTIREGRLMEKRG